MNLFNIMSDMNISNNNNHVETWSQLILSGQEVTSNQTIWELHKIPDSTRDIFVKDGIPNQMHLWTIILKSIIDSITDVKTANCFCGQCFSKKRKARILDLLLVCRSFNNLAELRKYFQPITPFNGQRLLFTNNVQNWNIDQFKFCSLFRVRTRKSQSISNRIYAITWIRERSTNVNHIRWEYGRNLPVFFFAITDQLMDYSGNILPKLSIPMFSYIRENVLGSKYIYKHVIGKMQWKKTMLVENLQITKGRYILLVLGSPFNLFEVDNLNHLQTTKLNPIVKIIGRKVCYLVYRIRSQWRYRIFMKSDTTGKFPIYFRTNSL